MDWGEREIIYLSLHCHHQNDFCIKMGSDESHFNVSAGSDGQSHKTVSTNHNLFEEKGEPKRYRTEVLPLTSLTARPSRLTKQTWCERCEVLCALHLFLGRIHALFTSVPIHARLPEIEFTPFNGTPTPHPTHPTLFFFFFPLFFFLSFFFFLLHYLIICDLAFLYVALWCNLCFQCNLPPGSFSSHQCLA